MPKPEKVFKVGAVRASIFRNLLQQQGKSITIPKVVLEVRYKDKTGKWKSANSFSTNEVPKAILALQKTFDYMLEARDGPEDGAPADSATFVKRRDGKRVEEVA